MGMRMLKVVVLAQLLASVGARAGDRLAVQAAGESVMTMRVDGDLLIDSQGRVTEYSLRTALDPSLRQMLDKAVPAWRLEPVTQGGRPVNAKTPMRIILAAREVPAGYEVRIDNVVFAPITPEDHAAAKASLLAARERGESIGLAGEQPREPAFITHQKMQPPRYPKGLMIAGVEGTVLLSLRLNPDGTVAEVAASQSSLLNVKGRSSVLDKARALLEQESMRAAAQWRYAVAAAHPELLDAEDLTLRVPIEFRMGRDDGKVGALDGAWRLEFRGPNLPAPWLQGKASEQIVGVSDLAGSEQIVGRTPFRLVDRSLLDRTL
jgi:TonB family protein